MGFFDLKLIIIIALTIICYFIYKELLHINKKLNHTNDRLINLEKVYHITNSDIQTNNLGKQTNDLGKQPNDLGKQTNNLGKQTDDLGKQTNDLRKQTNDLGKQTNDLGKNNQTHHELKILNDEYITIQNELYNLPRDISEDLNYVFNQLSMIPMHIPFNFQLCPFNKNKEELNETNYNTYIYHDKELKETLDEYKNEDTNENEDTNKIEDTNEIEDENKNKYENKYDDEDKDEYEDEYEDKDEYEDENEDTYKSVNKDTYKSLNKDTDKSLNKDTDKSLNKNQQLEEPHIKIELDQGIKIELDQGIKLIKLCTDQIIKSPEQYSVNISDKNLDNDTITSETSQNKITTPLEEFSNDVDNNNETTSTVIERKIQFNETKFENVLKNLNKYKLPELQDIAIEYNLGLQSNGKNKNKNQLLNEIKNYILNKNI